MFEPLNAFKLYFKGMPLNALKFQQPSFRVLTSVANF